MVLYAHKAEKKSNKMFQNQSREEKELLNINEISTKNTMEDEVKDNIFFQRRKRRITQKYLCLSLFKFLIFINLIFSFLSDNDSYNIPSTIPSIIPSTTPSIIPTTIPLIIPTTILDVPYIVPIYAIEITLRNDITPETFYPIIKANIKNPDQIYFDNALIESNQYTTIDNYINIKFSSRPDKIRLEWNETGPFSLINLDEAGTESNGESLFEGCSDIGTIDFTDNPLTVHSAPPFLLLCPNLKLFIPFKFFLVYR